MDATIERLLLDAVARLRDAGCDTPRLDAVLLLAAALGLTPDRVRLEPARPVPAETAAIFAGWLTRRAAREPVARILGHREFWSLDFIVTPDVLDPRPDSETLVEAVLRALPDPGRALHMVDFGTGSGCLLLALLHALPQARGVGVDASPAALAVARRNAERLGLWPRAAFAASDWGQGLAGPFDLLISNPPYIPSAEIAALAPEVAHHDPAAALDGGADGLLAYRQLVPHLARLAAPGALVALEVGAGQAPDVEQLLVAGGFHSPVRHADLGGHERVLLARAAAN